MKVLTIGLGSIARKHISALREINPDVEIIALRSSNTGKDLEGVRNIYDWDSIKVELPDFIIISNPTSSHYSTIQNVKELSIPLFIEKPIFSVVGREQDDLVEELSNKNVATYVACNLRFLQAIEKTKEIIQNERINEVNVYCGSYLPDWRPGVNFRKVYSANKEMGGGVHIDLIHELDYVYWIFGMPQKNNAFFANKSSLQISAFDYANYVWEYENFCASIILNYYRRQPKRSIELVCKSGTYEVDLLKNKIIYNGDVFFESEQKLTDTYKDQMSFFLDRILNKKEIFNSAEEANSLLKLCLME